MMSEAEENRRILAAIAGARIPGGCDDCQAHCVVHFGVLTGDGQDVAPASGLSDGELFTAVNSFRLAVYHDETCPSYTGVTSPGRGEVSGS